MNFKDSGKKLFDDDCGQCDILGVDLKNAIHTAKAHMKENFLKKDQNTLNDKLASTDSDENTLESNSEYWPFRPPPGIIGIGHSGWQTIHTFASYFPEKPTSQHENAARNLIESFAVLFPCKMCAEDLKDYVAAHPVSASSRQEFCKWTCDMHNHVNNKLGKPPFDCNLFDKYWRIAL